MPAALLCKTALSILARFPSTCGKPGTLSRPRVCLPQSLTGQHESPVASGQAFRPELPGDPGEATHCGTLSERSPAGLPPLSCSASLILLTGFPCKHFLKSLVCILTSGSASGKPILRHKSTRDFCKTCFSTLPWRAGAGRPEEVCLTLRFVHFHWGPLSLNRYVWEGSQPSGICLEASRLGLE